MRGKVVIVVLLVAALAFFAYALWFFGSPSTPDNRFNLTRKSLPASETASDLLLELGSEFPRKNVSIQSGGLNGTATYTKSVYEIQVVVQAVSGLDPKQVLDEAEPAVPSSTCAGFPSTITLHLDAQLPFRYSSCPIDAGDKPIEDRKLTDPPLTFRYEFAWINGNWLIQAWTTEPETLLRFVNYYPY